MSHPKPNNESASRPHETKSTRSSITIGRLSNNNNRTLYNQPPSSHSVGHQRGQTVTQTRSLIINRLDRRTPLIQARNNRPISHTKLKLNRSSPQTIRSLTATRQSIQRQHRHVDQQYHNKVNNQQNHKFNTTHKQQQNYKINH